MTTSFMSSSLVLSVTLTAAAVAATGLGAVVVLAPAGATPISGGYQAVADADAAAALLAGTQITAAGAAQLTAAFSQDYTPSAVYVATYDDSTEDPSDAADVIVAAGVDVGVLVPATVDDADLHALGDWLATGTRKWQYVVVAESRNTGLITSGKPSALDGCEVSSWRMLYGASDQGIAGAFAGKLQGRGLVRGPAAAQVRLLGVALHGETDAEVAFALANDVGVLLPLDAGSGATARIVRGTTTYSGDSLTAVVSLIFAVRRMRAALQALLARHATLGDALLATAVGAAEVHTALVTPLTELAGQGHFVPGTTGTAPNEVELPQGFRVVVTPSGDELLATVLLRFGQEVETITLSVAGEVV